jgi:hypothetical protein
MDYFASWMSRVRLPDHDSFKDIDMTPLAMPLCCEGSYSVDFVI